jgi:SAM-dependent methyltransferase
MDDTRVAEEFDRRAAAQPDLNAVLDAHDSDPVRRGNRLRDQVSRSAVLRILRPGRGDTVLDLGCGVGRLAIPVAARARRVIGVDVSAKMIEAGRAALARTGLRNVELVHAAGLPLPIPDGAVDKAFTCWALAHMTDERIAATLVDVRRCSAPGARFFAFEQVRERQSREAGEIIKQRVPAEYERLFAAAGFALRERRTVIRSPSYALAAWNRFRFLPAAALPLLDLVERATADRKPEAADYWTVAFTFERRP